MNDPHVVSLVYRVEHGNSVNYREAKPLVRDEPAFRLEVKDNQARFELKDHFATEEDARNAIKDYVDDWEFDACLEHGPDYFRLEFDSAQIEDRNPPPPTPGVRNIAMTFRGAPGTGSVALTSVVHNYPAPPSGVHFGDPNVQTMHQRYMGYRRGNEPLASMAYFCLSVLEHSTGQKEKGRRKAAAQEYQINPSVLAKIGKLSSEKGGLDARKGVGVDKDFTNQERAFLKQAIKRIIRRAAEKVHSPDKALPQISLSDLPTLSGGF